MLIVLQSGGSNLIIFILPFFSSHFSETLCLLRLKVVSRDFGKQVAEVLCKDSMFYQSVSW